MTVRKWFLKSSDTSAVTRLFLVCVLLSMVGNAPHTCRGEFLERETRKLFGGYRITPSACKSRRSLNSRESNICMFNHECAQRGGEVVGSCMDGFLFGACCRLRSEAHIPKGPGVVMTSYLDYPDPELDTADYEAEQLNMWHNSFKPVVTPGYRPSSSSPRPEDLSTEAELINEGVNQIASSLLNSPPEDGNVYINRPEYNNLHHGNPDTILYHVNGSEVNNVVRPVDFNVQISSMQTKPTVPPATVSSTQKSVSTHLPVKPIFKPRPATTTPNYVILSTVTKNDEKETEVSSINSIINMLNDTTPDFKDEGIPADLLAMETKSSPSPITLTSSYTTPSTPLASYSSYYPSTGHYVTLKPTSISTRKPSTQKPVYDYIYTSPLSTSLTTSQAIDAFNKYPTDPSDFGDSVTTFSYISSSTTPKPVTYNYVTSKPLTTRKPPSTSYVTGASPTRRPVTSPSSIVSSYDVAPDNFASATPTVIVLNGFEVKPTEASEPQFIEISQEPFKKPVSQITVNNNIASTNNIYVAKPPSSKPQYDKPSSPTVVITPKPSPITTPYPIKASNRPAPTTTIGYDFVDFSPTTFKPEQQTSPDDLINFPPVRNPMLNGTGSNPSSIYNSSISLSDNELSEIDLIHEMEFSTPTWQEDDQLKEQMSLFVSKIVGSLQGTFQELHDIVILDKKQNTTLKTTTVKPKKTVATTKRPVLTTRKPVKLTTTTRKPLTVRTTKKPVRLTTAARRTTTPAPTTTTTTKKPVTTTKKKPTKKVTTTTQPTTTATEEVTTETSADNQVVDYNDRSLCGVRPLAKSGRIVGGKNARFGEWPWQVLVRESTWLGLFTKNKCGGVLISSRFVTTAAHCQPGFLASLVAVFGENDISGDKEPKNPVTRNVRRVIVHKDYDAATFENDLALLELDTPIKFDAHIVPICMPPDEIDFTGRMATVTGWGRLKYGGGVPAVLQEVQVPVIENSACQEMFQTAGHAKKILNSFICAGYANGQKDSCEGDSGGPLVLQRDDGRWQLVGTVSHGIKCAAPFLPGVYMRTTYYKPWLKSITGIH